MENIYITRFDNKSYTGTLRKFNIDKFHDICNTQIPIEYLYEFCYSLSQKRHKCAPKNMAMSYNKIVNTQNDKVTLGEFMDDLRALTSYYAGAAKQIDIDIEKICATANLLLHECEIDFELVMSPPSKICIYNGNKDITDNVHLYCEQETIFNSIIKHAILSVICDTKKEIFSATIYDYVNRSILKKLLQKIHMQYNHIVLFIAPDEPEISEKELSDINDFIKLSDAEFVDKVLKEKNKTTMPIINTAFLRILNIAPQEPYDDVLIEQNLKNDEPKIIEIIDDIASNSNSLKSEDIGAQQAALSSIATTESDASSIIEEPPLIEEPKDTKKEKVTCSCGAVISRGGLESHYRSKKHKEAMKNN